MNIRRIIGLVGFLIIFSKTARNCNANVIPPAEVQDTPSKDVIHSCRQKCISEIFGDFKWRNQLMTYFRCRSIPNCFMCWDYCRAVQVAQVDLATSMCNDNQYCFKGCKIACNFHQTNAIQRGTI